MKINLAPAGIGTKYRQAPIALPTTPPELHNLLVLNIKKKEKFLGEGK